MRQGQNSKRSRGRSGGRRNGSPRSQSFDSNGPSIRIRGNAHQVFEKYIQLARDANAAGDRITAENMYQHAEHYYRIMNVDDGDSQRQNRGNGVDQRQSQRNTQQGQDGSSPGTNGERLEEQPAQNVSADGLNGSNEKRRNEAADPERKDAEAIENTDEPRRERVPRRTRRNGGRPRNEPTTLDVTDNAKSADVAVEPVEADASEVPYDAADPERKDAKAIENTEEPQPERVPRRTRRSGGRPRNDTPTADVTDDAESVNVATEHAEADASEVP